MFFGPSGCNHGPQNLVIGPTKLLQIIHGNSQVIFKTNHVLESQNSERYNFENCGKDVRRQINPEDLSYKILKSWNMGSISIKNT